MSLKLSTYRVGGRFFVEYTNKKDQTNEGEIILGGGVCDGNDFYRYVSHITWESPNYPDQNLEDIIINQLNSDLYRYIICAEVI